MKLDYEKIREIINQLTKQLNDLKSELSEIEKIKRILENHTYWEGESSNYYSSQLKKITLQFDDVIISMTDSIRYLQSVLNNSISLNQYVANKGTNINGG